MVEVLTALTVVAIITTILVSFINDAGARAKFAAARSDLARIAQAIQKAETDAGTARITQLKDETGNISFLLAPFLLDLPATDPWGYRYVRVGRSIQRSESSTASPYVVDEGLGRMMSGGPDGSVQTRIGQDPPDLEQDIVVDYRRHPWVGYTAGGTIRMSTADAASIKAVSTPRLANIVFSPNGLYFAGVQDGARLVWGSIDASNAATEVVKDPGGATEVRASANLFPVFAPNSGAILFVNDLKIYRHDLSSRQTRALANLGGNDTTQSNRLIYATPQGTIYAFDDASGTPRTIAISADGKVAFNRPGQGLRGIFIVSSSGGDEKLLVPSTGANDWLPVCWIGSEVLVYGTNPVARAEKSFSRVTVDGALNIRLHITDVVDAIDRFTIVPSSDAAHLAFFGGDFAAILRTDGSGFLDQNGQATTSLVKISVSNKPARIHPLWTRGSRQLLLLDSTGGILQVNLPASGAPPSHLMRAEALTIRGSFTLSQDWTRSLAGPPKPVAWTLSSDETLMGLLGSAPPGIYIIPLLGPSGAVTRATVEALARDEANVVRWLDL